MSDRGCKKVSHNSYTTQKMMTMMVRYQTQWLKHLHSYNFAIFCIWNSKYIYIYNCEENFAVIIDSGVLPLFFVATTFFSSHCCGPIFVGHACIIPMQNVQTKKCMHACHLFYDVSSMNFDLDYIVLNLLVRDWSLFFWRRES